MTPAAIAKLNTPPNPPYATKEAAVAVLITDLMQCVGIPATQAPPAGAYLPSGGLKVIDNTGGTLYAGDKESVIDVPAGAVTGPHLFVIAEVPIDGEIVSRCLPYRADITEVGRCYDFSVTPDVGAKSEGQGFGGNGVFAAACSPGYDGGEVHNYIEVAKVDHASPTTFTIYPRAVRSAITGGMACELGDAPPPPTASVGGAWSKVRFALSQLARPFTPRVAYAFDGVGSLFADLTHVSLVYRKRPLTVSPSSAAIPTGGSQQFTATPTDGGTARGGTYVWSLDIPDNGEGLPGTLSASDSRTSTFTAPAAVPFPAAFNVCVHRATAPADKGCASVSIFASIVTGVSTTVDQPNVNLCDGFITLTFTGTITANAAGDVAYTWDRSDDAIYTLTPSVHFDGPGTQTVTQTWLLGARTSPFTGWERLRTLAPNAMASENATFTMSCSPGPG
jgi:hypothetical protein